MMHGNRRRLVPGPLMLALCAWATLGCGPGDPPEGDAGACDRSVSVGQMREGRFVPLVDDDPVELLLGFQGFRMLDLAIQLEGPPADQAEVSAFLSVEGTGVELSQRTRESLTPTAEGPLVSRYLVFFNDVLPSRIIDQTADFEVIVRAGGCVGGARARVEIRDDDRCVDTTIVVDGGVPDPTLADAGACGASR